MKINQIGLQLYTLREQLKTQEQIVDSLRKVRKIGYQAVESGVLPIAEEEMVRILAGEGLRLCSLSDTSDNIRNKPHEVVERAKKFGVNYVMCGYVRNFAWGDQKETDILIQDLNKAGKILREAGVALAYHSHAIEFLPIGNTTMLDYLYSKMDPQNVKAELDTYWVQYGGGNPVSWCRKLKGRLPLLHLKDYAFTVADKPAFAAVGTGTLEWKEIIAAAEDAGCKWFIVEQDTTPGCPFEAIEQSFNFIRKNLVTS